MENILKKISILLLLALISVLSFLFVADWYAAPEFHAQTVASIDDKVDTVLKLTATSTVASAGISALPGDTATPIAEKLADFTEHFLWILCVLYTEKYLLTILGAGVFKILVPVVCGVTALSLFGNVGTLRRMCVKMLLIGLAVLLVIPCSVKVSDMIYDTFRYKIDHTITAAEEFTEETAEISDAQEQGILAAFLNQIKETASSLSNKAARITNNFVESLAVMIVTSCVIPVLVLLFFLWIIKLLTGIDLMRYRRRGPKIIAEA